MMLAAEAGGELLRELELGIVESTVVEADGLKRLSLPGTIPRRDLVAQHG